MAVPKLRFKTDDGNDFPAWEHLVVDDLFSLVKNINACGNNKNVITNSAEYGLIPQRNFFDKNIAVPENTDKYTVIEKGDFVYNPRKSSFAPYGPFNCYDKTEDGIVSPLYFCLRPKQMEAIPYLLYYFASPAWYRYIYNNGSQGGARHDRVGMTNDLLLNIPISLPNFKEQQKIADCLSTIDTVIADCQSEADAWEKYKRGVMQQLFSQKVRFKADDGSWYPEWNNMIVSDVCTVTNGKSNTQDKEDSGIYPFFVRSEIVEHSNTYIFDTEAVITVGDGNIGKVFHYYNGKFNLHQRCYAMFNFVNMNARYFYYCFSFLFLRRVQRLSARGTVDSVRMNFITDMEIPVPCLKEQQKIADCLSAFDEVIDKSKQKLEAYKQLKKGLLQQMFV